VLEGERTVRVTQPAKRLTVDREASIMRVTFALLAETGYQGLRYDTVATRAGASKATLYRHWPTKAELATAAIEAADVEGLPGPDTGTLRGDLAAYLGMIAEQVRGEKGAVLAGLFVAMRNDVELAARLRALMMSHTPPSLAICARAQERGELPPGYEARLVEELLAPALFMRCFALGLSLDARFIDHLVDDIALPLLTRSTGVRPSSRPRSVPVL
jgi:AcrR family transcriptional regulator